MNKRFTTSIIYQNSFAHLFVLFVIVLLGIGTLLYYSWQKGLIKTTPTSTEDETVGQAPNGDVANWKTYTNEEYGFEIKYPERLFLKDITIESDGPLFAIQISNVEVPFGKFCGEMLQESGKNPCDNNYAFYISVDKLQNSNQSLEDYVSSIPAGFKIQENITINGLKFIKAGNDKFTFFTKNNTYVYTLSSTNGSSIEEESKNLFNQILSTFKFDEEIVLTNTTWVLNSFGAGDNPQKVLENTEITGKFDASKGKIYGLASCNSYNGFFETNGNNISVISITTTLMICPSPEGIMEQEQLYLTALKTAKSYQIKGGQLLIMYSGNQVLTFSPK